MGEGEQGPLFGGLAGYMVKVEAKTRNKQIFIARPAVALAL